MVAAISVLCFLVISAPVLGAGGAASHAGRDKVSFNPGWKFIKADPAGAARSDFDDAAWQTISAPHTFNDTDTFDDWSPAGHVGERNQWAGRTWYRKAFVMPEVWNGKRVIVEFEGVRQLAEVYLNGRLMGTSSNGFVPFGFDLTTGLRGDGGTNVLAVMCDNTFMKDGEGKGKARRKGQNSFLPWNNPHWHPAHGGIYRNVWLYALDPVYITLPLFSSLATTGPYVYASGISTTSADVGIEVPVQNHCATDCLLTILAEVLDRDGVSVLKTEATERLAADKTQTIQLAGKLARPHRWEPDYPYLYTVRIALEANGKHLDAVDVPLGIRSVKWDVQTGFWINDHPVKLHGWGQKPTDEWPGLGSAFPDWMHDYTLMLMRDAGGNFVRWGHCAAGPAQISAGDRYGIVALQPGVDGEHDVDGNAWTVRAAAFRDMLIYYRNNPSILIWEGGNQKVSSEHARELRHYMDQYDPHGGRAYAHRRADDITGKFMDVSIGTEGSRECPALPVIEGEYNREEAPRRVWDRETPPWQTYHASGNYDLTAEQFAVNQVGKYVAKLGSPDHCGGANWIFSDSTSGGRVDSEVARTSGEVDGVRLPKEAYYACAAMWRGEPTVHIIGHWNYPAGTRKPIYVVSNGQKVELFVNGKSLGMGAVSDRYLFTFSNIDWAPGEIKAVASRDNRVVASQTKRTAGSPSALRLTAMTAPGGLQANGSDVVLLDVEAVDADGNRCPAFYGRVDFECSGPGVWRGGYNSGKTNSINNLFLNLECGINRVTIRSTLKSGTLSLAARSTGLKTAVIKIESQPVEIINGTLAGASPVPGQKALILPTQTVIPEPVSGQSSNFAADGAFIREFSYSGPTGGAVVRRGASNGQPAYSDSDIKFEGLPGFLEGADYLQLPSADKLYSAVDLIGFAVKQDGVLTIAHDDRLRRPGWLSAGYKATSWSMSVAGVKMTLFQKAVKKNEMLTLGSNAKAGLPTACNAYIVFVQNGLICKVK